MTFRFVIMLITIFQFTSIRSQTITLDDLIYFQTIKNSLTIDSVLQSKDNWDCNCIREHGYLDWIKEWHYGITDSSNTNIDKDYIKFDQVGNGFSSTITFYTTDINKSNVILSEMKEKYLEEKVQENDSDLIRARISFFIADNVVIQAMIAESKVNATSKHMFVLMDKVDYLKGLMIK